MDEIAMMIDDFRSSHSAPVYEMTDIEILSKTPSSKHIIEDEAYSRFYSKVLAERAYANYQNAKNSIQECPYFFPEEIEQLKDYYAESTGEDSWKNYFGENYNVWLNSSKPYQGKSWNQRILDLQNQLQGCTDFNKIDELKQRMVDLGWNPEIEYNTDSQEKAIERWAQQMQENATEVELVNIQPLIETDTQIDIINEAKNSRKLFPVSIVLVRGDRGISGVISKMTNSEFTHSGIALNGDFKNVFSFNFDNNVKFGGGFSKEDVTKYPKEGRLAIYTFFVREEDFQRLKDWCELMSSKIKDTTYSIFNLIFYPFTRIKEDTPDRMICSQFVDSCMKLINIDITGIDSAKVSPETLRRRSVSNAKIYLTFDGFVKDFNEKTTTNFLNKLSRAAKPIKESSVLERYLYPVVVEARRLPLEINKSGDVLLTNPFPDMDAEYASSHKLLMQYAAAKNYDAMKYELARLYYMNYVLERKLYHNKFLSNKEKNMKTRARVLNDFNKYMQILMKAQPDFNFSEYYEASPFSPHTVRIKASTIRGIKNGINYIL